MAELKQQPTFASNAHETRCVRGYRKADSLLSRNDCCVDANDVACAETSGPPELPGIERGVGLDVRAALGKER